MDTQGTGRMTSYYREIDTSVVCESRGNLTESTSVPIKYGFREMELWQDDAE